MWFGKKDKEGKTYTHNVRWEKSRQIPLNLALVCLVKLPSSFLSQSLGDEVLDDERSLATGGFDVLDELFGPVAFVECDGFGDVAVQGGAGGGDDDALDVGSGDKIF